MTALATPRQPLPVWSLRVVGVTPRLVVYVGDMSPRRLRALMYDIAARVERVSPVTAGWDVVPVSGGDTFGTFAGVALRLDDAEPSYARMREAERVLDGVRAWMEAQR